MEVYIVAAGFDETLLTDIRQPHSIIQDCKENMTLCEFYPAVSSQLM